MAVCLCVKQKVRAQSVNDDRHSEHIQIHLHFTTEEDHFIYMLWIAWIMAITLYVKWMFLDVVRGHHKRTHISSGVFQIVNYKEMCRECGFPVTQDSNAKVLGLTPRGHTDKMIFSNAQ